jgi:hypothetical protein
MQFVGKGLKLLPDRHDVDIIGLPLARRPSDQVVILEVWR